jgi:hypothetical protein
MKRCGHSRRCQCHFCYYCDLIHPGGWSKKRDLFDAFREENERLCQHMREAHPLPERSNVREWRWLYAPPNYRVLHRLSVMTWNSDDDPDTGDYGVRCCTGVAMCGYATKGDGDRIPPGWFAMPGIFSRLGLPRCAKCCAKVGLPKGLGTPWNDKELRAAGKGEL